VRARQGDKEPDDKDHIGIAIEPHQALSLVEKKNPAGSTA
jgi:hypothetical protein